MKACRSFFILPLLAALLLAGEISLAQDQTAQPAPRINRNPAYRENLPPAPPVETDPRDSTTRPVVPPEVLPADGRSVVQPPPAAPEAPASAPAAPRVPAPGASTP